MSFEFELFDSTIHEYSLELDKETLQQQKEFCRKTTEHLQNFMRNDPMAHKMSETEREIVFSKIRRFKVLANAIGNMQSLQKTCSLCD